MGRSYFLLIVKSKPKTIDEVLGKFEPEQKEIAQKLRVIVKTTLPDVSETVRRGVITYVLNNKVFARVNLYKDHVDLSLLVDTKLDDKFCRVRDREKMFGTSR